MKLYSMQDAAAYLNMKLDTLKYHVYRAKNIPRQTVGGVTVLVQDDLDRFQATRRGPGRKPGRKPGRPPAAQSENYTA